jgi:serine/threonine-protein kinase RsbW
MFDQMKAASGTSSCGRPASCTSEAEGMEYGQVASPAAQSASGSFVELRHTLLPQVDIVSPFVDELMRFVSRFRVADGLEIELALREALVNAIVHGNQEDPHKHVYVKSRYGADGEISIKVEDEGVGFDIDAVPDPTSADNRLQTYGRGIYLIRTLMDEVHFELGGSVVHMRKRANADADTTRKAQ